MAQKLTPTNYHRPCPICQDRSGDCRIIPNSLVLCHSFIEQDSGVAGWRWRNPSSNGVWGVHVPDNGKEFDREQYQRYLARKKAQERDREQFLANNALDADGRDRAIRKLSRYVGLNQRHRQDLKARGLSERQIKDGLFFSIDPWTRFDLILPENLPGIHYKGDRFCTKDTGYACPIFDKQGRAIGWQLRVEGVTEGNKYRWAKGGFSSHLANGELPLTIVKPENNTSKTLYLSEGILKPYIASNRLNLAVCGAANNGNFSGSPQQFTEIQSDFNEFVIAPDAGDVLNPQVLQRWLKQINFLKQFNKPIKILWWKQVKKDEHDLDEIELKTFFQAESLTPQAFLELAKKHQYIKEQWDLWREAKKFTPQIKIHKRFVEFGVPEPNTIFLLKAALGTGKTTQLIKVLEQLPGYGILNQGYRNTLLLQYNEKASHLNFYHLQSDKKLREFSLSDPAIRVSNCIDSLIHFVKEQFDGKIVVIDELVSVLKHLLYSPTIKHFGKVKQLFNEMINRADRIIGLDGFMQDWAVKFFKEICPGKQIVTLENTHQGDKPQIYLLEGTIDINEQLKVNDKTPWLQKLLQSKCPVIFSDSQIFCEAIENWLIEQGRTGIRIDSKTVSEKHVKEFLKDPDKWIAENRPEYMVGSPSIESGLDIALKKYFSEHFLFFFGQLDIDSCIQILGRIRDSEVPKFVWCKKFILSEEIERRPSNVESLQADRARSLLSELNLTIEDAENLSKEQITARIQEIYQSNLDPYTTTADRIKKIREHEFANYRECLKEQLINHGYPVKSITLESLSQRKALAKQEREAKDEVKLQNATDIFNASDKYIGQDKLNLNFDASWETRAAVTKAQLVLSLPRINLSPLWSPELIKFLKYDKLNLIRQTELYYLMQNPELAQQLALLKYNRIFNRGSIAAPWKLRQDYLKIKALIDIGLNDFIQMAKDNPHFTYRADSPEIQAILAKCQQIKHRQVFGTPGKDPLKFFHRLLHSVGVETQSHSVKKDGKVFRVYHLDYKHLLGEERLAILEAIQLKYEQKINVLNQPLEWVTDSAKSPENPPEPKSTTEMAESIETKDQNEVTLDPNNYINNSSKCYLQINQDSLVNLSPQLDNTNQIQDSPDSGEDLADLAWLLSKTEDASGLAELKALEGMTSEQLNQAMMMLDPDKRSEIAIWSKELEAEQQRWDFNYLIQQIERQFKRVGGTIDYWKQYLREKYQVTSRLRLKDEQILEFWDYLQGLPAKNWGQ